MCYMMIFFKFKFHLELLRNQRENDVSKINLKKGLKDSFRTSHGFIIKLNRGFTRMVLVDKTLVSKS